MKENDILALLESEREARCVPFLTLIFVFTDNVLQPFTINCSFPSDVLYCIVSPWSQCTHFAITLIVFGLLKILHAANECRCIFRV